MSAGPSMNSRDEGDLSPTSPIDESDSGFLSPPEPEPKPGLHGAPVRWYDVREINRLVALAVAPLTSLDTSGQADRNEAYTKIEPFAEKHDTTVEFFYHPLTLSALAVVMSLMAYVATTDDLLEEGKDKRRLGVYAAICFFLLFSMLQFRDGPFIRPHPAFWRIVLGINLLYELALVFLLFQDLGTARLMMKYIDPSLGVALPEKSYAEHCEFTAGNILGAIDIFCLAHALGWFGKALILRDYWFCWILSIAFELAEYSLQHQLPNFAECWWDHWLLDVLVCNWLGTYLGMKTCQYFEVKHYEWRGLRQSRGFRSKTKRVITQFSPHDFTAFNWEGTASFRSYVTVVLLLAIFLAAELNPFYLKTLLWMEPDHPIIISRLAGIFVCGLPAVREHYQYMGDSRKVKRMGSHAWLLLATVVTELVVIRKWSRNQFPEPFPRHVKIAGSIGVFLLILYPLTKFGIPSARRYLLRQRKELQAKSL